MNYKLIATDFDGTLLNNRKKVSLHNAQVLDKFSQKGFLIVGLTGRTFKSTKKDIDINIFDYLLLNNGSNLYNVKKKEMQTLKEISREDAMKIVKEFQVLSHEIDFVSVNNYYVYEGIYESGCDFVINIQSIEEVKEPIVKMNIYIDDVTKLEEYVTYIKNKYINLDSFIMQDSFGLDKWLIIMPRGINKLNSLEYLGNILNIPLKEMLFFGDGLNDLEVISKVGLGIAMGNALEEVKKKAKYITKNNNEDGVAYFLEEYFQEK